MFPVSALRGLITDREQERKLWNYIGPSIIHLNPDKFERLQELDPLQIKILLKNSDYYIYEPDEIVTFENGGILFEGSLEERGDEKSEFEDSVLSASEKGFGAKHKVKIRAFRFLYPTSSKYIAKDHCRLYSFPASLKDSWLSFNPQVLADAFSILPGANQQRSVRNTIGRSGMSAKRQKTIMIGLPKDFTVNNQNPLQTFKQQRSLARGIKSGNPRFGDGLESLQGENTIMPKGFTRAISRIPKYEEEEVQQDPEENKESSPKNDKTEKILLEDVNLNILKTKIEGSTDTPVMEGSEEDPEGESSSESQQKSDEISSSVEE